MKVWRLFFLFLLYTPTRGEDTVAEDLGVHQIQRLVELLTSKECEDLRVVLSQIEVSIFKHLKRLLPKNNILDPKPRGRRDTSSSTDREAECRILRDWLLHNREQIYYDRLSRALQHIGRTDIAEEVGKNINQDKALSLKRYVEDYHKKASRLKTLSTLPRRRKRPHVGRKITGRSVRDVTWRDLDLVVEWAPFSPHRGVLDGAWPFLYGVLLGMGGVFLLSLVIFLLMIVYTSRRDRLSRLSQVTRSSLSGEQDQSKHNLRARDVMSMITDTTTLARRSLVTKYTK